jgi:zinc protease
MNAGKVIRGMDEELERFVKDGVSADELEKAKVGYLNQRNVARSNDRALVSMLSDQLFDGRTMQFEADFEARIRALTPEAVNAAIRKHLDPKKLIVITAGDFKTETGGGR